MLSVVDAVHRAVCGHQEQGVSHALHDAFVFYLQADEMRATARDAFWRAAMLLGHSAASCGGLPCVACLDGRSAGLIPAASARDFADRHFRRDIAVE